MTQHIFFACPLVRLVWRIVPATFNLLPPISIMNKFGILSNHVSKKTKACALLGFWLFETFINILFL
jgi:hypothetical protein